MTNEHRKAATEKDVTSKGSGRAVRPGSDGKSLARNIKRPIQKLLRRAGYDIHRRQPDEWTTLSHYPFRSILDIGANEGQFAHRIRALHPNAMIHSFEPLTEPYELLKQSFANDSLFQAHLIALGETCGKVEIFENGQSDFSSMLPMNVSCRNYFPAAEDATRSQVLMITLDQWAESQTLIDPFLIKVDVQGYEDRVIRGGIETMQRASVIMTEVSFTPLYRFQPLFHDIYMLLHSLGFKLIGLIHNMYDLSESTIVQADAIFENTGMRIHNSPTTEPAFRCYAPAIGSLP